jgi:hypothetical protein
LGLSQTGQALSGIGLNSGPASAGALADTRLELPPLSGEASQARLRAKAEFSKTKLPPLGL